MMEPARPRRVLVLALSFGAGHMRAASAVAAAIRRQANGADVRVGDALADASLPFRAIYGWTYWAMLRFAPWLWKRLFAARLRRPGSHTAPAWLFRLGCRRTFRAIRDFDPDVIVAAEVGACEIAVIARRAGWTRAGIVAVITDAQAEPPWVAPEVLRYAVPTADVGAQLLSWGVRPSAIAVTGIPIDLTCAAEAPAIRADERRVARVLLMGGGMGPTHMDEVARALVGSGEPVSVVAVAGHDRRVRARLERLRPIGDASLTVYGWRDDVPELMRRADILVTKPGGLTMAEATAWGVPLVLFDPIPGPEETNAARVVRAGAGVLTRGSVETAQAVRALLRDPAGRGRMTAAAREMSRPDAAALVAGMVLAVPPADRAPVVLLTIANGAGHTRAAEAVAAALPADLDGRVELLDVADYLSPIARFTHVTAYLWLVRHAPGLWRRIDAAQKGRTHTSPEWYYRRTSRRLFASLERLAPRALVATEVGCCEIAALAVRDLFPGCPLVAVNGEYDADRAWVQREVSLYVVPEASVAEAFVRHGAARDRVRAWGVPLAEAFDAGAASDPAARARVAAGLALDPARPIVLVAGGSEGLGDPAEAAREVAGLPSAPQVILLSGRSAALRDRATRLLAGHGDRVRVLGWTADVADLMRAADVLVSKLGHVFDEAVALRLPIVALPCPPGAEHVQLALMEEWGVGVRSSGAAEAARLVGDLLQSPERMAAMRAAAAARPRVIAAPRIAAALVSIEARPARPRHVDAGPALVSQVTP